MTFPSPDRGWLASYPGARPHIASFTGATDGTKVLMQIIGPPRWTMTYVDESGPARHGVDSAMSRSSSG